jgi:hypothetical protein
MSGSLDQQMFRMDPITKTLVERECQKYSPRCPYLTRLEIETLVLAQLEADGKIMRYLAGDRQGVAWRATPKTRRRTVEANQLREAQEREQQFRMRLIKA